MSPRVADPAIRTTLIEAAARMIATEGPDALTLRRVADEVGTSTMAIYTHFGSMAELRREVRREGFARLADHLGGVARTRDTVTDLVLLGWAYFTNGVSNPHLYRAMFMEHGLDLEDAAIGIDTFEALVNAVRRCVEAGRFDHGEPLAMATHLWSLTHGIVTLHLAGFLSFEQARDGLAQAALNLFIGYGDDRGAVQRSIERAARRVR